MIKTWLLVMTFLSPTGDYRHDMAFPESHHACEYAGAMLMNDYSYIPEDQERLVVASCGLFSYRPNNSYGPWIRTNEAL
jgi:hypothetical protein